jgi:hypothetical protein
MKFNKRDYLWVPMGLGETTPILESAIQEVEKTLGVKLPESYLNVMKNRVGNRMRFSYPAPSNYPHGKWLHISDFMSISGKGITKSAYLCKEWDMPENIVLLGGDGHTWLGLDYRNIENRGEPSVVFIDNDTNEQVYYLAPNFDTFIDSLTVNEENESYQIGFKNVGIHWKSIIKTINQLFGIELKQVEKTLIYSCRHPEWQSKYPKSKAFFSFYPNSIYPWFPEYEWLLSFDVKDPQIEKMIWEKILESVPYEIKRLKLSASDFY